MEQESRQEREARIREEYPMLSQYTVPVLKPVRKIYGREKEIQNVFSTFFRPEMSSVMLLADAGTGKTALVQELKARDKDHRYREVNLAALQVDKDAMAENLKLLFEEAARYSQMEDKPLVLFIDEFHQIIQTSPMAVEAMKPILARTGQRGVRFIAATTFNEFRDFVAPNKALTERFFRINLAQPDRKTVIEILRNKALTDGVMDQFHDNHIFRLIYEYTERYMPADSQPRKSLNILDQMVGIHRMEPTIRMNRKLLSQVLQDSVGVNVAFRVNAQTIEDRLNEQVLDQQGAARAIERRLQICVADLNDHTRPMSSFLFMGSTGVGKTQMAKELAAILFDDPRSLIRFNMTEYGLAGSVNDFRKELARAVWTRPYSIILLDEIEKAAPTVNRVLMQVLDDGMINDEYEREVSFKSAYIIATTNAGAEIFNRMGAYPEDAAGMKRYDTLLKKALEDNAGDKAADSVKFPAELINRFDCIVGFRPLDEHTYNAIADRKFAEVARDVKEKHGVNVHFEKDETEAHKGENRVRRYIVEDRGESEANQGGARAMMSKIYTEVVSPISTYINTHSDDRDIYVYVDGMLRSDDKEKLKTDAVVQVAPGTAISHRKVSR